MKYIDRKGNMTIEDCGQDRLIRRLYQSPWGRVCVKLLVRPWVSRAAGAFLETRLSARLVPGFIKRNGISLSGCKKQTFTSFNDFFTRELREGERKVAEGERILVSPCDGRLTVSRIDGDSRFYIKDTHYTLKSLLRSERLSRRYRGGYCLIFRLCPEDYHHYIYPAEGEKSGTRRIPGVLHTVNPLAGEVYPVYKENTREYTLIKTERFGTLLMMEVGAMMVGRICSLHRGPCHVKKGEEKGHFAFGGSTIVLLIPHGRVWLDFDLEENCENGYETLVEMGERIGECKLPKRTG
ncbi:MAG: phosphatidylserine decarboxylase [Eubacteriales bacterium]|nr:phosphatidylserine decarboxylase [Eubacteriales bacterium]